MLYAFIKSTILTFLIVVILVETGAWYNELTILEETANLAAEVAAQKGATAEVIEAARVAAAAYNEGPSFPVFDSDLDYSADEAVEGEEKDQKNPEGQANPENQEIPKPQKNFEGEKGPENKKGYEYGEGVYVLSGTDSESETGSESSSDQLPPFVEDENANLRDFNDMD